MISDIRLIASTLNKRAILSNNVMLSANIILSGNVILSAARHPERSEGSPTSRRSFATLRMTWPLNIITLISLLFSIGAYALPSDKQQPFHIQADSADLDRQKGIGIYRGHVKIQQGSTLIEGDIATTYFDKQNQLEKAIIQGQRAHYQTLPAEGQAILHARANTLRYFTKTRIIELDQDAEVTQAKDHFKAPFIRYNMQTQHVQSPADNHGRTEIIIYGEA